MKQFCSAVGMSDRSVRRYIKKGVFPNGNKWQTPQTVNKRYVFSGTDLEDFLENKTANVMGDDNANGTTSASVQYVTISLTEYSELKEVKGVTGVLTRNAESLKSEKKSLENSLEKINKDYYRIEAEKKYLDIKLTEKDKALEEIKQQLKDKEELEAELNRLKNRNWFKRLFDLY